MVQVTPLGDVPASSRSWDIFMTGNRAKWQYSNTAASEEWEYYCSRAQLLDNTAQLLPIPSCPSFYAL